MSNAWQYHFIPSVTGQKLYTNGNYVKMSPIRATDTCHMQRNIISTNQNPYTGYLLYDP